MKGWAASCWPQPSPFAAAMDEHSDSHTLTYLLKPLTRTSTDRPAVNPDAGDTTIVGWVSPDPVPVELDPADGPPLAPQAAIISERGTKTPRTTGPARGTTNMISTGRTRLPTPRTGPGGSSLS